VTKFYTGEYFIDKVEKKTVLVSRRAAYAIHYNRCKQQRF